MSKTKIVIDKDGNELHKMCVTTNQAYKSFKTLTEYCNQRDKENVQCQNCIFHKDAGYKWECILNDDHNTWSLDEVEENYRLKKMGHGYIG